MDTIFKFLHSIMFTLTLQISKLTKAVVLNSFTHGRFWQFAYKENVRCTRLMQRSLQVVIRQKLGGGGGGGGGGDRNDRLNEFVMLI